MRDDPFDDAPTPARLRAVPVLSLICLLAAALPAAAQTGQTGDVCVEDFADNSDFECVASDVETSSFDVVSVHDDGCTGPGDTTLVVLRLDLDLNATSYDIGIFVALDGGSANTGDLCLHDYLAPPFTMSPPSEVTDGPWLDDDGDSCGDAAVSSILHKTLGSPGSPLEIACVDADEDDRLEVSFCAGWTTGPFQMCGGLAEAGPPTSARCHCQPLEALSSGPPPTTTTTTLGEPTTTTTTSTTSTTAEPPTVCAASPVAGCVQPEPGKSKLVLSRDADDGSRNRLTWKWKSEGDVSQADFTHEGFDVCIYAGGTPTLQADMGTASECMVTDCWTPTGSGMKYSLKTLDGLTKGVFSAPDDPGSGRIVVKGRGASLGSAVGMLTTPVVVQVLRGDDPGKCWEATFTAARINEGGKFVGNSN